MATRASGLSLALAKTEAVWCGLSAAPGGSRWKRPIAAIPQLLAGRYCLALLLYYFYLGQPGFLD